MKKNHRSKQLSLCAVIPYLCKVSTCMGPPRKDELLKRCVLLRRGSAPSSASESGVVVVSMRQHP